MESFPRGGKKPGTKRSATTMSKDELKPKKRKIQTKEKTVGKEKTNILNIAQQFSKQQLCQGYVFLGRIRDVKQLELTVSLPDGLVGSVEISDISKAYTKQLKDLLAMVKSKVPVSLTHMFKYGDYVTCYVKTLCDSSRRDCKLSLDPELINQNISINYLAKGSKIVCSVKCIEDHGYLMDTGIGVEAFLAYDQVEKGKQYFTGSQILCAVKNFDTIIEPSFIQLTAKKTRIDRVNSHVKSWDVLTPGTKLLLRVTTVLSDGLRVTFGEDNVGYINQIYLSNPLSTYTVNMEVIGTLLYRQLLTKFAYFSLLTDESEKEMLRVGDIIERAKCLYKVVDGVVLKLSKSRGLRGYVSFLEDKSGLCSTKFEVGSTYKCRVVSYNLLQHLYVCTTNTSALKDIYFSASDFNIGDVHDVTILDVRPTNNYVAVSLGRVRGIVPREHISDSGINCTKQPGALHKVQARVLDIDRDKNRMKFTLKRSLVNSQLPILQDFGEAKCGSKYHGTVSLINRNGLLVRFYGLVKGWVSRATLNPDTEHMNWNFFIGQTVTVRVESVEKDKRRMNLTIVKEEKEKKRPVDLFVGEMVKGTVSERTYLGIYVKLQTKDDEAAVTAFLPAAHMALCTKIGAVLTARYAPGDVINSIVFATEPTVLLTHTLVTQHKYRNFDSLKVGDSIPSSVWEILPNGVKVVLPIDNYSKLGFVSRKCISNFEKLHVNQILFVKIIAINSQERRLTLTMSLKAVYECLTDYEDKMTTAVGILHCYLSTQRDQEDIYEQMNKPISSVYLGQKVVGVVKEITENGLLFRVSDGLNCIVRKEHCIGNLKLGDSVCGTIMWKNYPHNILNVTLVKSIGNSITSQNMQLPELPTGVMLKAKILLVLDWFVLILVKRNGLGHLAALPVRRHINDIAPDLAPYKIHTKIRVYVVMTKSDTGSIPICLLKSAFEVPKSTTVSKISATKTKHVKKKKVSEPHNLANSTKKALKKNKVEEEESRIKDIDEHSESNEDSVDENETQKSKTVKRLRLPECGFSWNDTVELAAPAETSSDDDEEPEEESERNKKKKISAAERREQERQKEREIRQREEALVSNQIPNSVDQFDKLVLANPDSSLLWMQYMAYHLQATEIDKARAVARQAVKKIHFMQFAELSNVWKAWLNLETRYGTAESLNDVFQEAVKNNDPSMYLHILTVHEDAGKKKKLKRLIKTMTSKFKDEPNTWTKFCSALPKLDKKSRRLMRQSLNF
ncbi:PREDICTED: protein RRP5 homolog [Vollenhovia emeryi]|uniref:protein RRP5 homolog n=1 Tax=Vollenhovia emeryi TaxID=411798 RepID=UPI0005F3E1EA|nr:PREDICTED: protein RRP5 homolog [Vollenhovia emeryi]